MLGDKALKEGWLNRHIPTNGFFSSRDQGYSWRLAYARLLTTALVVYSVQGAFPRALTLPDNTNTTQTQQNAPGQQNSTQTKVQQKLPSHTTLEPHPELVRDAALRITSASNEAIVHYILFIEDRSDRVLNAIYTLPFANDLLACLTCVKAYLELIATKEMEENELVQVRVPLLINEIASNFGAIVLNDTVYRLLQDIAEALAPLNDAGATALKLNIYKHHENIDDLVGHPALIPLNTSCTSLHSSSSRGSEKRRQSAFHDVGARLAMCVRQFPSQIWIPSELFLNPNFQQQLAETVAAFHRRFWAAWAPTQDLALLFHRPRDAECSSWYLNPLVFDAEHPHFLGTLLFRQVLNQKLSLASRGHLLEQWVQFGAKLRSLGDIVGWVAVVLALTHVSVLRLTDSWAYVSQETRTRVSQEWGFEAFELEKRAQIDILQKSTFRASTEDMGHLYPRQHCVPYFVDIFVTEDNNLSFSQVSERLQRIRAVIDGWHYYYDQNKDSDISTQPETDKDIEDVLSTWLRLNASLPNPLASAMADSFAVQPQTLGHYISFYVPQRMPLANGTFLPLLFTEANPTFRLLPKPALVATAGVVRSSSSKLSLKSFNNQHITVSGPSKPMPLRSGLSRSNSFPSLSAPLTTGVRELELDTREHVSSHVSGHALVQSIRDLFNVHTKTHFIDKSIVVKSFDDDNRTSRTSSVIENLGRRSLLHDNKRQSIQSIGVTTNVSNATNVVIKAASLPRLVDILVLGVGEFVNFSERYRTDLPVFTETFLATFRSFCSPETLIKMISDRFRGTRSAAASVLAKRNGQLTDPFPDWQESEQPISPQTLQIVVCIYRNICEALQFWFSEYYFDFSDNSHLRESSLLLLKSMEAAFAPDMFPDSLRSQIQRIIGLFTKQRYCVTNTPQMLAPPPVCRHVVHLMAAPSINDLGKIEEYLDELDAIVAYHFKAITMQHWIRLFEVLELQIADSSNLFNYSPSQTTNEDELHISNIFSYLSTLYRTSPDQRTLDLFPAQISQLFTLHNNIADYIAYQLAEPMIYVVKASLKDRFLFVLKLLGVLKTRMRYFELFPDVEDEEKSRVPSFLESAIVSGILRPESRAYAQTWLQAGKELSMIYDPDYLGTPMAHTLYIPTIPSHLLRSTRPITPCVGWVIERVFEIVCYVPNMALENPNLINFDKHRYVFNLVKNISTEFDSNADVDIAGLYVQYDYLVNPDASLYKMDRKAIKAAVLKETHGLSKAQSKQSILTSIVGEEVRRIKREAKQLENLSNANQLPSSSSSSGISLRNSRSPRARPTSILMNTAPRSPSSLSERSKSGRSRFGAGLLKAVRPLSMAFSSPAQGGSVASPSSPTLRSTPLPEVVDPSTLKEVLNLDLAEYTVVNGVSSGNVVRLNKGAQEVVLQTLSEQEAQDWIAQLTRARTLAIARLEARPGATKVFGVPLEIVCTREKRDVPEVFTTLIDRIETRGLDEVGLYRISGSLTTMNALKSAFDSGETLKAEDMRWADINAVAGCVKLYIRELPEPLFTNDLFSDFVACASIPDEDAQLEALCECLGQLPRPNLEVLKSLVKHLNLVVQRQDKNKMTRPNLAIVFSMNFLPSGAMDQIKAMQKIVLTMLVHQERLFPER